MKEIWKLVEECPHYEVSNKGRVRSMTYVDELGRHHDGKIIRQSYQNYATVWMSHIGVITNGFLWRECSEVVMYA